MKKLIIPSIMATLLLLASCDKGNDPILPEPEPTPEPAPEPDKPKTMLCFSTSIEMLNEVTTRGTVSSFEPDSEIGLFYNDTCINKKFVYDGKIWSGGEVALADEMKDIICYYPYSSVIKSSGEIPIDIGSQTDYLVGSASVGAEKPEVEVKMKHLLSLVRITIKKNNYIGDGHIESLTWNGIHTTAKYNAADNTTTPMGSKGSLLAGGNYYLDDTKDPIPVETIMLPVNSAKGITLTVVVDGEERVYDIPESHQWEAGKAYTYTLTLKGGYNSPIDLEEFPIDVGYWSTFGKTDDIVLGNSEGNWFDIEPGEVSYGTDIYRNEGFMFGFYGYWTGLELETGNMPDTWEGDFRMVLMDNAGNIVDKFQPCSIVAENGAMMKGTARRSYVTAPAGTYELGVLFRKKGETIWQKANHLDKVTREDMTFTIKEQTDLPALRMIQVEEETNTGVVIHNRPYDSNFNITYVLSNRGKIPLKGEIKAVWERTFDYTGHCYRPSSKRTNTVNDNEWQDEIGRMSIDLQPTIRFWKGSMPCRFPQKREMPRTSNGIGYCMPMVHLYWKAEGSSEWILLRCDLDEILAAKVNSSQEESNLFGISLNYISFEQSHWNNQ